MGKKTAKVLCGICRKSGKSKGDLASREWSECLRDFMLDDKDIKDTILKTKKRSAPKHRNYYDEEENCAYCKIRLAFDPVNAFVCMECVFKSKMYGVCACCLPKFKICCMGCKEKFSSRAQCMDCKEKGYKLCFICNASEEHTGSDPCKCGEYTGICKECKSEKGRALAHNCKGCNRKHCFGSDACSLRRIGNFFYCKECEYALDK